MIRRVRAGQTVVRLKAGDPFVFGRGAEEVDALHAAGLPVTVVPGITAALGCAASVGIALTDRRVASTVTFESGHAARDAGGGHTRVIYMAISEAAAVRDRLVADGVDPATPVVIIENGTRPDERVSTGRLSDLTRLAAGHLDGPSLIIVGEVAARVAADRQPSPRCPDGQEPERRPAGRFRQPPGPTAWWSISTMPASGRRGSIAPPSRATRAPARSCWSARGPRPSMSSIRSWWPSARTTTARIEPCQLREKIRASGLTFDAIAAESVRYA
jgi:precorrin-6B methylase 1